MKIKRIFSLLLALLIFSMTLAGCSSGEGAGSFSANTLDGGTFTQKDIADKDLTVINFWGTFCSPCIAEMPALAEFEKALPDNVQLITICIDAQGNEQTAKDLLSQAGYEGVTLTGGDDGFNKMLDDIQAVPTTIFVGPDGKQVGKEIVGGPEDLSGTYLAAINKALKASGKAEISLEE